MLILNVGLVFGPFCLFNQPSGIILHALNGYCRRNLLET